MRRAKGGEQGAKREEPKKLRAAGCEERKRSDVRVASSLGHSNAGKRIREQWVTLVAV